MTQPPPSLRDLSAYALFHSSSLNLPLLVSAKVSVSSGGTERVQLTAFGACHKTVWTEKCCKMYRCLFLLQSIYTFPKTVIMKRPNFFTVAKPQTSVTKLKSSPKRCYHPVQNKLQILLPFWFHTETSKYSNTTQTSENYCNQWHYKANSSYPKLFWFGLTSIDVHVVYTVQPISFSEAVSSNCSNILFYWKHFNK